MLEARLKHVCSLNAKGFLLRGMRIEPAPGQLLAATPSLEACLKGIHLHGMLSTRRSQCGQKLDHVKLLACSSLQS